MTNTNTNTNTTVQGATVIRVDQALTEVKAAVIEAAALEKKATGMVNNALSVWGDAVSAIASTPYWMNSKLPGFEEKFFAHHRDRLKTALIDTKRYEPGATLDTTISRACAMAAEKLCDQVQAGTLKAGDELFAKLEQAAKNSPANVAKATAARRANAKANKPKEKAKPAKKLTPKAELKAKLKEVMEFATKHKFADAAAKLKAIKV
jgi:hypothetical protein